MKKSYAYVLIGFVLLAMVAVSMLSHRERFGLSDMGAIGGIKDRLTAMENKIKESDDKRKESVGTLNSTLR
jgi:hypothetical protein